MTGGYFLGGLSSSYARVIGLPASNGTDDTSAINALIATATAGQVVRGLPGQSYIASSLTLGVAGVTLDMTGCTITQKASTTGNLLNITAARCTVLNGTWDGNSTNQSAGQNRGIAIQTVDDCTVRGATVQNTKFTGIYALGCNRALIADCKTTSTGYIGIFVETNGTTITDNTVVGCTVDRSSLSAATISEGGVKVHGASAAIRADRSRVDRCTVLMPTSPVDGAAVSIEVTYSYRSTVRNSMTSGGAMGISLAASDNSTVVGNEVYNAAGYGIEVAGSRSATITANVVDGNSLTSYGIILDAGGGNNSDGTTVNANTVIRTTNECFRSQAAIRITVTGNTFISSVAAYCANIQSTTDSAVTGNVFEGTGVATKGIIADTCQRMTITGNAFHNFTQNGILLYTSTAFAISEIIITGNMFSALGSTPVTTQVSGGGSVTAYVKVFGNSGTSDVLDLANNVGWSENTGSPVGVVGGGTGSIYSQRNGGAGQVLWINEGGTNTSWRKVQAASTVGTATLVAGTVTVADAAITANSIIRLSYKTTGGTPGAVFVSARVAATSFTITSTNVADTSVISYEVLVY